MSQPLSRTARFFVTAFGIGNVPVLPGTLGSLFGLIVYVVLLSRVTTAVFLVSLLGLTVAGLAASQRVLQETGEGDPSWIVMDEVVGMLVALIMIPVHWPLLLLGFCLFRFFDIIKLFPLNRLERLPGAWGVFLDDVGAGLYTNLILQLFLRLT